MAGKPPRPPADWDDSTPKTGSGEARDDTSSADESPDSKIRGPAGQH
jgi:hypothetical protein